VDLEPYRLRKSLTILWNPTHGEDPPFARPEICVGKARTRASKQGKSGMEKEVRVAVNGSRSKQTLGIKLEVYSELASILGNWDNHQQPAMATDTNEPPFNVNQLVPVTPQRDPGGAENPNETKSLKDLETALQAERAASQVARQDDSAT